MTPQKFLLLAQDSGIHRTYLCFGLVHTCYAHNEEINQGATDAATILQPATSENRTGKHTHAQLAAQKRLDEARAKLMLEHASKLGQQVYLFSRPILHFLCTYRTTLQTCNRWSHHSAVPKRRLANQENTCPFCSPGKTRQSSSMLSKPGQ